MISNVFCNSQLQKYTIAQPGIFEQGCIEFRCLVRNVALSLKLACQTVLFGVIFRPSHRDLFDVCQYHSLSVFQEINDTDLRKTDCRKYDKQTSLTENLYCLLIPKICESPDVFYDLSPSVSFRTRASLLLSKSNKHYSRLIYLPLTRILQRLLVYTYSAYRNSFFGVPIPGGCARAGNFCSNYTMIREVCHR